MAKFEANIPSYLKSGAGSVPIDNNFEKITGQPGNLSEVIDNYTNNFSGSIRSPDNLVSDDTPVGETYGEGPVMKENEILPTPMLGPVMGEDKIFPTPMLDPAQIRRPQVQEVQAPQQPLMDDDILVA